MAQLERIRAVMEWRWYLEGENEKEENGDDKGGPKNDTGASQKKGTLSFTSC